MPLFGTDNDPILWLRVLKVSIALACAIVTLLYAIYLTERQGLRRWARRLRARMRRLFRRRIGT